MPGSNPSHLPARTGAPLPANDFAGALPGDFSGDGSAPPEAGTDWRRIRSALWRFKWLVITLPVLAAIGGYGASRLIKPLYRARATVWINKQAEAPGTQLQPGAQFGTEAWVDLIRSYTVIDRAVSERHLSFSVQPFDSALTASFAGFDEHFTPGSFTITIDSTGKSYILTGKAGTVVERGPVGGPVGAKLGYLWTPPVGSLPAGKTIAFSVLSPRQAALDLLDRLRVTIDATGTFLHAELTGNNPARTAETLNAIVENFVRVAVSLKSAGLADRTQILDRQMKSAQGDLTAAESALEQFRLQSIMRPGARAGTQPQGAPGEPGSTDPAAAAYFTTQAAMNAAVRDSRTIRRVLAAAVDSGLAVEALETVPAVVASSELSGALKELTTKRAELRALELKYTDSHPLVIKARTDLMTMERVEIPALANRVVSVLATREAELSASVASTAKDLRDTPGPVRSLRLRDCKGTSRSRRRSIRSFSRGLPRRNSQKGVRCLM